MASQCYDRFPNFLPVRGVARSRGGECVGRYLVVSFGPERFMRLQRSRVNVSGVSRSRGGECVGRSLAVSWAGTIHETAI
jgi:hypothetical protein